MDRGGGKLLVFLSNLMLICVAASGHVSNPEMAVGTTENPGFISIDCGVDADYTDNTTGIFYNSDDSFISTGKNAYVQVDVEEDNSPYYSQQLKTLRYFPEGEKNCYTLRPERGKNHRYYIRVFFLYGNYDGLNDPPTFDLFLGVDYWVTVELTRENSFNYYGMLYFASTDSIDVCMLNTNNGIPFISTLESRLLDDFAYRIDSGSLKPLPTCDFGSTVVTNVRYKDDVFDRIWMPCSFPESVPISTTEDIDNKSPNDSYKLPVEVLRTAIQPKTGKTSLSLIYTDPGLELYIYFHFAEIEEIEAAREFTIDLNGITYGPFALEYLKPLTLRPQELPIQDEIRFSINSTLNSSLPPILNAFEIFFVQSSGNSRTNPIDVSAMMNIKQTYKMNKTDWQGDPCLPRSASWSGLNCSSANDSRIISLNLSSSKLTGEITSALWNLTAMQSLDLSNNELSGAVPEFLAQMPNLTVLKLTGNSLTFVPHSLLDKSERGLLQLSLDENLNPCQRGGCDHKKRRVLITVVVPLITITVLILFSTIVAFWRLQRKVTATLESLLKSQRQSIKYSEIVLITKNFKTVIGEGGFGKVYLGELKDGTRVAVKLLSESSKQGYKEFQAEVQLLISVHHKNLVSLIGFCDERGKMALVYECMANGNLRQFLSGAEPDVLHWSQRLQIAVDAAIGLEYLHNGCKPAIIHRDLKPSNILLNENLQAKISDFGMSKVFGTDMDTHVTTRPAGTLAYLDPEFQRSGNLNKKSDVYSFGILLFEIITGKPVVIPGPDYNIHIIHWVLPLVENGEIESIVDSRLGGEFNNDSAWKAVQIAKSCVPSTRVLRPDISQVLLGLKECLAMVSVPTGIEMAGNTVANICHSRDVCLELDTEMAPSPSFGILLFEIITGKPVVFRGPDYNTHIVPWVLPLIGNGDIQSIVDPRLRGEFDIDSAWKAVHIAKSCVSPAGKLQPDISQVLVGLKECLAMETAPPAGVEMAENVIATLCHSRDVCLELETEMALSPR